MEDHVRKVLAIKDLEGWKVVILYLMRDTTEETDQCPQLVIKILSPSDTNSS